MNERLTIRNWQFEIFRWLPIGRCDISHGSAPSGLGKAARRDAGDKRQYRGSEGGKVEQFWKDCGQTKGWHRNLTYLLRKQDQAGFFSSQRR
jgi:hypothetical protein